MVWFGLVWKGERHTIEVHWENTMDLMVGSDSSRRWSSCMRASIFVELFQMVMSSIALRLLLLSPGADEDGVELDDDDADEGEPGSCSRVRRGSGTKSFDDARTEHVGQVFECGEEKWHMH